MQADKELQPEVIVFAGPNGSGKSTITRMAKTVGVYINADDIKKANLCTDMIRHYSSSLALWRCVIFFISTIIPMSRFAFLRRERMFSFVGRTDSGKRSV